MTANTTTVCSLLLLLVLAVSAQHDNSFCEETKQNSGDIPPVQPNSFAMSIRTLDTTKQRVIDAWEYFDGSVNRGAVMNTEGTNRHQVIVDYKNQQTITLDLMQRNDFDNCDVQQLNSGSFMTRVKTKSGNEIYIPSKAFFFPTSIFRKDLGINTTKGISVKQFYSCHYWQEENASLKITWSFRTSGSGGSQTAEPFMITVDGQYNANKEPLKMSFEVSRFSASLNGPDFLSNVLIPMSGAYCKDMKFGKDQQIEALPERFSIDIEKRDVGGNFYVTEIYDFTANLSLIEYEPDYLQIADSVRYGSGRLLMLHDFLRKVAYIKNLKLGNCTYEPISNSMWDSAKNGEAARIRNPREFFDIDTPDFQYKGTKSTRGIKTDVFVARRKDYPITKPDDCTFEWGFANKTKKNNQGLDMIVRYPVSLNFMAKEDILNTQLTIYNYNDEVPNFMTHDVSTCFNNHQKQHVMIEFNADDTDRQYVKTNKPEVAINFLIYFAAAGQVSPIRLFDTQVYVDDSAGTVSIEVTVSERSPYQQAANIKETALAQVINLVTNEVNKQDFQLLLVEGDEIKILKATKIEKLDERSNAKNSSTGYSAGELVGLILGMFILAVLFGLISAFLYWK